jgi:hypothetical protein
MYHDHYSAGTPLFHVFRNALQRTAFEGLGRDIIFDRDRGFVAHSAATTPASAWLLVSFSASTTYDEDSWWFAGRRCSKADSGAIRQGFDSGKIVHPANYT